MQRDGEASVEEILDSIKKVIARDNRDIAQASRVQRETRGMAQPPEADTILDLGEADEMMADDADHSPEAGLITGQAEKSMRESLAVLSVMAEPGAAPQIVRSGETSLEGMAREMLRPMLAQWLDSNLPPIVEKLVAAEIARIAGKKGR